MNNSITETKRNGITTKESAMETFGKMINSGVKNHIFNRHLQKLAKNTRRSHLASLSTFVECLRAMVYLTTDSEFKNDLIAVVSRIDGECLQTDPDCWKGISYGMVEMFVQYLQKSGYAIGTINIKLSAVKTYAGLACAAETIDVPEYKRIELIECITRNEGINIDQDREQTRIDEYSYERKGRMITRAGTKKNEPNILSLNQMKRLTDTNTYQGWPATGIRDHLIMCLLCEYGFRCGELAGLRVQNFNLENKTFTIYRPKVKKSQTFKLYERTYNALLQYLRVFKPNDKLLICTTKGGKIKRGENMTARAINSRVQWIGQKVLQIVNLSPHDLRHSFFTAARQAGNSDEYLKHAGGWSSNAMLDHYAEIARVANENVILPF